MKWRLYLLNLKSLIKNTMPGLMALELLALVRRVLQTSPHINTDRKEIYIDRHKKNEDWTKTGAKSAGFYNKYVLWNKPVLKASIDDIHKRFKNLNFNMKK